MSSDEDIKRILTRAESAEDPHWVAEWLRDMPNSGLREAFVAKVTPLSDGLTIVHDPEGGCSGCPFYSADHSVPTNPAHRCSASGLNDLDDCWSLRSAPGWCPLRSGPVTVTAKEKHGR